MMHCRTLLVVAPFFIIAGCNGEPSNPGQATDDLARRIGHEMPWHTGIIGGPDYDPKHTRLYLDEHGIDPKKLVASALVLSKSVDGADRQDAARLLGLLADPAAVQPLLTQLQNDPDEHVRMKIVGALQHLGPSSAVETGLVKALNDKSPLVRSWAVCVVGYERAYNSEGHIRRVMEFDEDTKTRVNAAKVLVDRGEEDDAIVVTYEE